MGKKFLRLIKRLYEKEIDATGIGIFRICYTMVLLCEVIQLYYFRHLIFDKIPYLQPGELDPSPALIAWMVSIVFVMLGLFTRQAAIMNYLFSLVFISTIRSYEYHMFYAYMGLNFLLIIVNSSARCSIDRLRLKLKYSNTRYNYIPPTKVTVLNYYILLFAGIAVVYFDSIFYKLSSHNWMNGIGMWLPSSLPQNVHIDASAVLNIKWISLALGYITVLFEAVFLFTFFRKKWRVPLLIIGIGLHLGIVIQFPIPWFGLGVCALYLLMVPVSWWNKIRTVLQNKVPRISFYYDEECPLCNRTRIILNHFDIFNAIQFKGVQTYAANEPRLRKYEHDLLNNIYSVTRKGKVLRGLDTYRYAFLHVPVFFILGLLISVPGIYEVAKVIYRKIASNRIVERCTEENCGYVVPRPPVESDQIRITKAISIKDIRIRAISFGVLLLAFLQLNVTYNAKFINYVKSKIGLMGSYPENVILSVSRPIADFSKMLWGITAHPVFMDSHFNGYNHIIGVEAETATGNRIWLPIIKKNGFPDTYLYSFNWVKWTFRVDAPKINQEELKQGIRDFAIFWAIKNGHHPDSLKFRIYVKRCEIPLQWERNFLKKQMEKPWKEVGVALWRDGQFLISIPDIESL